MRSINRKLFAVMALSLVGASAALLLGAAPEAAAVKTIQGITKAGIIVRPTFAMPGIITKVLVKEGDIVKIGQVLMEQDTDLQKAEVEKARLEAESIARLEYFKATRDTKKRAYDRMKAVIDSKDGSGAFSVNDLEAAELELVQAEAQIKVGDLDFKGNQLKFDQEKLRLDKMQLKSTVNGIVREIKLHEGEMATPDPEKYAITLVQNDPCDVTIDDSELPSWQVARLKIGDILEVRYKDETQWRQATIWFIDPVVGSLGSRQEIKAKLPNPEQRATGVGVEVKLPAKATEQPSGQQR